jgi:hypothetical protein
MRYIRTVYRLSGMPVMMGCTIKGQPVRTTTGRSVNTLKDWETKQLETA